MISNYDFAAASVGRADIVRCAFGNHYDSKSQRRLCEFAYIVEANGDEP